MNLDVDYRRLKGNYTKAFYYDAIPVREDGEAEPAYEARIKPIRAVLDAVAATDGMHVYEGDARRRRRRGLEQKKVDVMLAVDMLTHAFRRNMHKATLLTGDGDFKPLIDALVQDGMFVTLWYPPDETSVELMQAADARKRLDMRALAGLLTDESRMRFALPDSQNVHPSMPIGDAIDNWQVDGKEYGLFKNGNEFIVTWVHNQLNRLQIKHSDFELLCEYCRDSVEIQVPEMVKARIHDRAA